MVKRYLSWLRYKLGMRKSIMGLRFTTTWKCDSRCITCNIWKDTSAGKNDMTVEEIDRFSRAKCLRNVEYITLSGGEPTLRKDLPEVVSALHRNIPRATFGITTHGMHPQLEEDIFRKIFRDDPGIKFHLVGISLNGPPEIHDRTRGIEGSWQKAVETYDRLKNLVHCEFSFTFCRDNVDHFEWVQDFAKSKGTRAYICWTVMNERFDISDQDLVFWRNGMDKMLQDYIDRNLSAPRKLTEKLRSLFMPTRAITLGCLYDNIINKRIMPCYAGAQIVHVDPEGNVYPCNFKLTPDRILGNVREKSLDDIWASVPAKVLNEIKRGECMYPNGLCGDSDIYPSIYNSPPFVFKWYLPKLVKGEELISAKNRQEHA